MCIVIDTNTLSMVFNESNARHPEFCYVKKWIDDGIGVVIYGGTKYKRELAETRYMRLLRQMRDAGQAISISDEAVNTQELIVQRKTHGTECDDQHVIALLGASRCPLLCSTDSRSFKFVKRRNLYPKDTPVARIYSSSRNKNLLKKIDRGILINVSG